MTLMAIYVKHFTPTNLNTSKSCNRDETNKPLTICKRRDVVKMQLRWEFLHRRVSKGIKGRRQVCYQKH